jgi:GDP-4-dehydro-6-deoxy-D-mannose reductase
MRKKALLIGGTGFVGTHLQQYLQASYEVYAYGRNVDIRNATTLNELLKNTQPDVVVNLAAITTLSESFENPEETYEISFMGTLNLLKALKNTGFKGVFLFVSSSEVYGYLSANELPVDETRLLKPNSPYAVGKISAEALCYYWSHTSDFKVVIARPFNHFGPKQSQRFAVSKFAKQIIEIKQNKKSVLKVGDIDTTRDFTDVRDIVRAYGILLEQGHNGEIYNVCSGKETSIRLLLNTLLEEAKINITIKQEKKLLRTVGQKRVCGSYAKLFRDTGWKPQIPLKKTLWDILDYWDTQLK